MNQLAFSRLRPRLHYAEEFENAANSFTVHTTPRRKRQLRSQGLSSYRPLGYGERRGGGKMGNRKTGNPGNEVAKTEPFEDTLQTREI